MMPFLALCLIWCPSLPRLMMPFHDEAKQAGQVQVRVMAAGAHKAPGPVLFMTAATHNRALITPNTAPPVPCFTATRSQPGL
eukprot:1158241-Pelagomonas_calceolata.AAC.5